MNQQFKSVQREGRVRIQYNDIETLAESIYAEGFIHPPCISQTGILIAGGRRFAALDYILANHEQLAKEHTVHPDIAHFIATGELVEGITFTSKIVENLTQISKLELIENVQRNNFTWQENCIAVAQVHKLESIEAAKKSSRWGRRETGRLLGIAHANVQYCITLTDHLQADPNSPLWKCSTISEAMQYLAQSRFDEANKQLANLVKQRAQSIPVNPAAAGESVDLSSFIQKFNPNQYIGAPVAIQAPSTTNPVTPVIVKPDNSLIEESFQVASSIVKHAPAEDLLFKILKPESIDHIITDPPYAIDMKMLAQSNQGQQNIDRVADTHDVDQNLSDFPVWLEGCHRVLKPKGYCIWFCDQMHWDYLYQLATNLGFKVTRWPFTWVKTSRCSNQRAEYNFTKATEIAMVMRKGDARLVSAQATNYWLGSLSEEDKRALVNHPFIKPTELWQLLARAVAHKGSTICDPFSGVGSSTRAFLLDGYQPVAGEKEEHHYTQQLSNIAATYQALKS